MNNYQLLIGPDKQELDLDEKVGIALSKTYENLDNPTKIYATWSKTIQVPMTAKNNRIFDNLFRQDQAVTTVGIDPRKKIPFVLLHNQEHILTGYAKVNNISNSQKDKKYEITLYSVIADIINDLKLCTFDARTATDPKYVLRNPLTSNCVINRNLVKDCWEQESHIIDINNKGNLDWIGFLPSYQGHYDDFDSSKLEIYDGRVDPYHNDPYESVEVDEHYLGEYRSYYQQPYVWVDGLFQLLKEKIESITDYKFNLDPSWFNNRNPYWTKAIITCPSLFDSQDETGQNPKETYNYHWNQIVSNTTRQEDLSNNHKQILPFTHQGGTHGIYDNVIGRFRAPSGGTAHFRSHYLYTLFAAKTDPQLADGYARLRDDNNLFIEFRAVDAQTLEYIPGAVKKFMFYSNSTDVTTGYDTKIDVGIASRNYPDYVTTPDDDIVRKDTGYAWAGEINVDMDITWNRPYYIIFNQYAANNSDPFEFALGSWVPRWDWLWTDFYQTTDVGGVAGIRGHYWFLTMVNCSVEEASSLRSNSKLTMDRVWNLEKSPFDFLLDYCKMFRLVFDVDEDTKTVTLMSRNRYFTNYTIEDWTDKLDRTKDYKLEPINFNNKYFNFKYKEGDGQRFKYYQDKYGSNYGAYKVDTGYDFNTDSTDIFTEVTPSMVTTKKQTDSMHNTLYPSSPNYLGATWKYLPKEYFVENDDDGKNAGNSGAFYFRNGRYECDGYMRHKDINGNATMWISDDTDYQIVKQSYCWTMVSKYLANTKWLPAISPYSGSYAFQFQQPKELYYNREVLNPPSNTKYIYDTFWRNYLDDRYSVQTKVLTCYMYLTANDFLNFRFNKFVMVDNVLYIVNKIYDFNLTTDKTTKVQLVQVNNLEAYTSATPSFPYLYTAAQNFTVRWDNISEVEVFSSSEWEIVDCSPWIWTHKNNNMLQIRAYDINYGYGLEATITLRNAENATETITVGVDHEDGYLRATPNSLNFSSNGGTKDVSIASQPQNVSVVSQPKWCNTTFTVRGVISNGTQPIVARRNDGNIQMHVAASANSGMFSRSGNITVTNGFDTITVAVTQPGTNRVDPVLPVNPNEVPDQPIRYDFNAGEAVPVTLHTSKEVNLNTIQITDGVTSSNGSKVIDEVTFLVQPEMSQQHIIEGKTSDGGVVTIETVDGDLVKWNYNLGDTLTTWTVTLHTIDTGGWVGFVWDERGNYCIETVEDGDSVTVYATPDTGYDFLEWSDGDTGATRTIEVHSDLNLYPIFAESSVTETYTITNNLTYTTSDNLASTAVEHTPYRAYIEPFRWYTLSSVTVTMDGVNITTQVYSNGVISIPDVTGDVVITAVSNWGDYDYVWSSQEGRGPLDFTQYNNGGTLADCTIDPGSMQGDVWVHREGRMVLPTADNLVWEMECGFIQSVTPGQYPVFDICNNTHKGAKVIYDQLARTVITDTPTGSLHPIGQGIRYGKEPQYLYISDDNARFMFKYGQTVAISDRTIANTSNVNTIVCRVGNQGVDMFVYTIRAKFRRQGTQYYTASVSSNGNGSVVVNGVTGNYSQTVQAGTQLSLNAIPNNNYAFDRWSDGNINATRTVNINANTTLTAYFVSTVPSNDEIWYWTTDGQPLDLTSASFSGGTVTSNTYTGGKGVIKFDNSVTGLLQDCFRSESTLLQIHLPASVTLLGESCFENCVYLTDVRGLDNVTTIGPLAFHGDDGLTTFTVPDGVTTLGYGALANCFGLTSVKVLGPVTELDRTFFMCRALKTIELPDTLEMLTDGTFYGCIYLKKVVLPPSLRKIVAGNNPDTWYDYGTFRNCGRLEAVEFNNGLVEITKQGAFASTVLTSAKLPDTLTKLGSYIFYKCDQMDTVVLGSGLTEVGDNCFEGCSVLKKIYCTAASEPHLGNDVFLSCPTGGELHILNGASYPTWVSELPAGWTVIDDL